MSRSPIAAGYPSRNEGTLHCYLLDYLHKRSFGKAAAAFAEEAGISIETAVPIDAPQGLLFEWWSVFWDVFLATGGKRDNPQATVYAHAIASQKERMQPRGQAPQQMPQQVFPGNRGNMNVNTGGAGPQAGPSQQPPPQGLPARMSMAQQQQLQRQLQQQQQQQAAAAAVAQAQQQQNQAMAAAAQRAAHPGMVLHPTARMEQGQPVPREFVAECMHSCGFGGRSYESLSPEEQEHLQNFMNSPQARQMASLNSQRIMQQQQAQQAAIFANQFPQQNGAYYQGPVMQSPNPQAATPQHYQGSPPASAPAMQQHFSAQAAGPPSSAGRRTLPVRSNTGPHHASAPPTPEMSNASLGSNPTSSPRARKRPRTDAQANAANQQQAAQSSSQQQQQQQQAAQINGMDYSSTPARPASAASARGGGAQTAPSPRLSAAAVNRTMSAPYGQEVELESEEGNRQPNGIVLSKPPERKRSPMAPPPVPVSAPQAVGSGGIPVPVDDHDTPNGLGSNLGSGAQSYYTNGPDGHGTGDLSFDHVGGGDNHHFSLDDLNDFDINSFINIGEDFSVSGN